MDKDFIEIFGDVIETINPIISSQLGNIYQLKKVFRSFSNIDIDEVLLNDKLDNEMAFIYMGETYGIQTNDGKKDLTAHEMIVVIGSKESLEIARIMKNNLGGFKTNGGKYYNLQADFLTPMSATEKRFFKTAIGIYATE